MFKLNSAALRTITDRIDTKMRQAGEAAVAEARRLVPVRTGYLQSTIGYTYRQSDRTLTLHADAPYAAIIEEGSINRVAHPFLRPALNSVAIVWGGSVELHYANAYAKSGKPARPNIAAANRAITAALNRGRSKHATVRYRRGPSLKGHRWSKTQPE